jgi:peroxiredoxin Q/BCP
MQLLVPRSPIRRGESAAEAKLAPTFLPVPMYYALSAAMLCWLAGCTGNSSASASPRAEPAAAAATPAVAVPPMPRPSSNARLALASPSEPQLGTTLPDLSFALQDGFKLDLPALRGKRVIVFFCASADDPECLREMRGLRSHYDQLHERSHVVVVGVTPQDQARHKAFLVQQGIPFDLASDPDRALANTFGVPEGPYTPRIFLVDTEGKLEKVWRTVDPGTQVREILALAHTNH